MPPSDAGRPDEEVTLEMAPEEMRRLGYAVIDRIVEHFATLRAKPAVTVLDRAEAETLFREDPPEEGVGYKSLLDRFDTAVAPYMTHVDHPRMFAFVPGAGTFVGAMGDALASGFNIYAGTWLEASAASQLELVVVDWFRQWLGLPESAGGTLVSGGSVANLTALAVARERSAASAAGEPVIHAGAMVHSSVDRAARLLGLRRDAVRRVPVDADYRMSPRALEGALDAADRAGERPVCVVATAGATSTGAVDPLDEIADMCAARGIWLHVDAAYGGFAALDPRGRRLLRGLEGADSVALDPHKWLYTPFEAGCVIVRDRRALFEAFHTRPDYLSELVGGRDEVNFCDYGIQLSRAARALKIWMTVQHFGLRRIRATIGRTLDLARYAERRLAAVPGVAITTRAVLGVVTFRYVPADSRGADAVEALNRELFRRIRDGGRALLSSTRLDGDYVLRICVINHSTRREDVDELVGLIAELGPTIASGGQERTAD